MKYVGLRIKIQNGLKKMSYFKNEIIRKYELDRLHLEVDQVFL